MSPIVLIGLGILGLYLVYRWRRVPPVFNWRKYDANGDGVISGEEISAAMEDHNAGIITDEQFLEVMAHVGEPPPEEPPEEPPPEEPPPKEPEPPIPPGGLWGLMGGYIRAPVELLPEPVEPYTGKIGHYTFGPTVTDGVINHSAFGSYPCLFKGTITGKWYWYRRFGVYTGTLHWYMYPAEYSKPGGIGEIVA